MTFSSIDTKTASRQQIAEALLARSTNGLIRLQNEEALAIISRESLDWTIKAWAADTLRCDEENAKIGKAFLVETFPMKKDIDGPTVYHYMTPYEAHFGTWAELLQMYSKGFAYADDAIAVERLADRLGKDI